MKTYKVTIEEVNVPENKIDFYLGSEVSIENLLSHEQFSSTGMIDAKTGLAFIIKEKVLEALKIKKDS